MDRLFAGLLGICVVAGAGCSSPPPTSPVPPSVITPETPGLVGAWAGFYHVASCTAIKGPGCPSIGYMYAFRLTIDGSGDVLTGSFEGEAPTRFTAALRGVPQADGSVTFEVLSSSSARVTVSQVRVVPAGASGFSGRIAYTHSYSSNDAFTVTADIRSASRMVPPPPWGGSLSEFVGSWAGKATHDVCEGFGTLRCNQVIPQNVNYRLTLLADGAGLAGLMETGLACWPLVRVSGAPQSDGTVLFTGTGSSETSDPCITRADVLRLQLAVDRNAGLVGSMDAAAQASGGSRTQHVTFTGGTRSPVSLSPGPLQGHWRGDYIIRGCVGDCERGGQIGRDYTFSLKLSQTGGELVGQVDSLVPVTGSASGRSANLEGERLVASCPFSYDNMTCTQRVRGLSVTVDEFGQMHGSLEYYKQGNNGGVYEMTLRVDLLGVIRVDEGS